MTFPTEPKEAAERRRADLDHAIDAYLGERDATAPDAEAIERAYERVLKACDAVKHGAQEEAIMSANAYMTSMYERTEKKG